MADTSVVYGVFFYSPTCPHCHEVINNHWPGIQEEFGDRLQVLFIDVTQPSGSQIMRGAIESMQISSNGVPMLIIGSNVLIGSYDIPQRAPEIIRNGLNSGGIGYPPIPGIDAVFETALQTIPAAATETEPVTPFYDPANVAAVFVLVGLVAALALTAIVGIRSIARRQRGTYPLRGLFSQRMALIGAVIGIVLSGSLVLGSLQDTITLLISGVVLAVFAILSVHLLRSTPEQPPAYWVIPLLVIAGVLVAGYLAYVELTLVEATCGTFGDCNTVQQSAYSRILGIPVGLIGILGYVAVFALWATKQFSNPRWVDTALFAAAVLGVVFSTYLTFLEPFVIGATCVWCLTSAVVMGILLWLTAPAGFAAIESTATQHQRG